MKRVPIDDLKVEPEVGDSIELGDRSEDYVDIVEDRKWWCVPWWITVYNGVEGKYMEVWKIAEVHESSKWELLSWLKKIVNFASCYQKKHRIYICPNI